MDEDRDVQIGHQFEERLRRVFVRIMTLVTRIDDDGPGIRSNLRELAFAVGERLDDAAPGTGLGLAIVKKVLEDHGGKLILDDAPPLPAASMGTGGRS